MGVCAFYMIGEFKEDVKCAMLFVEQVPDDCEFKVDFENPSFYDLSGLAHGEHAKGYGKVTPSIKCTCNSLVVDS